MSLLRTNVSALLSMASRATTRTALRPLSRMILDWKGTALAYRLSTLIPIGGSTNTMSMKTVRPRFIVTMALTTHILSLLVTLVALSLVLITPTHLSSIVTSLLLLVILTSAMFTLRMALAMGQLLAWWRVATKARKKAGQASQTQTGGRVWSCSALSKTVLLNPSLLASYRLDGNTEFDIWD